MNERVQNLINKIQSLEEELRTILYEQKTKDLFNISGRRIRFEKSVREAHKRLRIGTFLWLRTSRPQFILTAPIIFALFFPMIIFDISLLIYQMICFRIYRIPRVKRSKHIMIDRHRLAYLNLFEKLNCVYCEYANGLIAYAREIASRTEQYWCPIKHAHKMIDAHKRYAEFIDYGDAESYHDKLEGLRLALSGKNRSSTDDLKKE